ncbi:Tetratricopeptide repeat-containing protein [Amphibacillus marinus]|uniref:Tetratricopeptide repeat-containing protein n=1 Tax=Amphibacillus marinus TaxID=872970 RepID=A0A1H8H2J9_9BACI|nr:DUF5107 domain-containing protein [Amphibacillus marinus]SEN50476.1 Tetratricopeptide repeat-containing protein [Amphibacillus marinus]
MKVADVKLWEETVIIPTYEVEEPNINPLFFERRIYQGSSGKVYPLPVTEGVKSSKRDQAYQAIFLENEYVKIMFLPELGGRIQRAYDKTNNYDFVYYNEVIKPALVGLAGPWISGGIEFNWPQHHRPTTFMPVNYTLKTFEDGRKTLFMGEVDQMYGTKGMAAFTLYPDRAYLEIKGQLYNRTEIPQTFLWWANPAVAVNDHTYSVFPPDVHAVFDHGKRDVSAFPIATGTYYKYDYSAGVDISKYKNIKVPTSYMAAASNYDFIGHYDEAKQAGLLHVADHHLSPGKKQWTWGSGEFGQAWDRQLTDKNGPYIELMTGVFTDNQPDFSWLAPFEEKAFTQYFMPYKAVGRVKNANKNVALNIEPSEQGLALTLYASIRIEQGSITLYQNQQQLYQLTIDLAPAESLSTILPIETVAKVDDTVEIVLTNQTGQVLLSYRGQPEAVPPLPEAAEPLPEPSSLKSTEELFLAATHIEQYHHATLEAEHYYVEGLRRDTQDIRLNNGYGLYLYRQGKFKQSEQHFRRAIARQTWRSPNPLSGEVYFNLGLSLFRQDRDAESYAAFYKASWNDDYKSKALYYLACLAYRKQDLAEAEGFIEQALYLNKHHMKARGLQLRLLRSRQTELVVKLQAGVDIDPLDLTVWYEWGKLDSDKYAIWLTHMQADPIKFRVLARDYMEYGCFDEAMTILTTCPVADPLNLYYQAYLFLLLGQKQKADQLIEKAEACKPSYCFPNTLIDLRVLEAVIAKSAAPRAHYYLANLYYDKKRHQEAIRLWERCAEQLPDFPTVFRNLSFSYYNVRADETGALAAIEKAVALDRNDARLLLELDSLKKRLGHSVQSRLNQLDQQRELVATRDDLLIEYLSLQNIAGYHQAVYAAIEKHQFHPWEGGEGKVTTQFVYCLTMLAIDQIATDPAQAIACLKLALTRPENLGEGKLPSHFDNRTHYYLANAYQQLGDDHQAMAHYRLATYGSTDPEPVIYYNDQSAENILYIGLAHQALGEVDRAQACFHKLITFGTEQLAKDVTYDYFAVSLPANVLYHDDLTKLHQCYCHYVRALGFYGLQDYQQANENNQRALAINPADQSACYLQKLLTKQFSI